jgi:hypothetical protein
LGFLLVVLLLVLMGAGIVTLRRAHRAQRRAQAAVTPQQLAKLAQPYRSLLGEAVAVVAEVRAQAHKAPSVLQQEFLTLAARLDFLVRRALPRAEHGSELAAQLLKLSLDDAQYAKTSEAARAVEAELAELVATFKTLRGKVYQIVTDAGSLTRDSRLGRDLEDTLLEVSALEEAFSELPEALN